jgi:hypothetical protein
MDRVRRLVVALETGSIRAFVGEEIARQADAALGCRAEGEALSNWIVQQWQPETEQLRADRNRLVEFLALVQQLDGSFDAMAAKVRDDLDQGRDDAQR